MNEALGFSPKLSRKPWLAYLAVSLFSILSLVFVISYSYFGTDRSFTETALQRRVALSALAAQSMEQRLNHIIDIGKFLAADLRFRQFVSGGEWQEAINIHRQTLNTLPFVEQVILTDPLGTLMADMPEDSAIKAENCSHHDWYQGVRQGWKPYVSEVYRGLADPPRNTVAVAIPVWAKDPRVVGILVLQIKLAAFLEWSREPHIDSNAFIYFVDQKGNLIAHPEYSSHESIVNFSIVSPVQRVLKGESGILIATNPIDGVERVAGFAPVKGFGWGAILAEPTPSVFKARESALRQLRLYYGLFLFFSGLSGVFIVMFVKSRLEREKELQESRVLYEQWLNHSTDGIWDWNLITDEVYLSPHFKEFLGYTDSELPGHGILEHASNWEKIVHPDDLKLATTAFKEHTENGKPFNLPLRYYHKSGAVVWVLCRGVAFKDRNGRHVRMLGTLTDINELIHVKEMNRLKDEFIDTASHELRTPLTVIKEGVNLFRDQVIGSLDVDQRSFLTSIEENVLLLSGLIDTLLDLSKIEAGQLYLKKERVDLAVFIRKCIADHQLLIGGRIVETQLENAPAVYIDAVRVRQIFSNLFSNAIKFTKDTGTIRVLLESRNGFLVTSIQDDGIGVAPKDIPKLFKKFSRVDENFYQGTGLGLALCKELVELHGGNVWVVSTPGKGATFTFTLPSQ